MRLLGGLPRAWSHVFDERDDGVACRRCGAVDVACKVWVFVEQPDGVEADAKRNRCPDGALQFLVQFRETLLHLPGRPHRSQRVVLVRYRDAEDGDNGVADELLHRSVVALDRRAHRVEVAEHHIADRLGVDALPHRGRARHVAEEQRGELAPLSDGRGERGATAVAEASAASVLGAAGCAAQHVDRLRRTRHEHTTNTPVLHEGQS